MNAADTTEDRVATLHALLNDSAVKIGEQRLVIKELREALKPFAAQTRVSSLTEEAMIRRARNALKATGEA